ncbi:hypothetical protein BH23ACT2_BH23ACT2_00780 [soil metagenome]
MVRTGGDKNADGRRAGVATSGRTGTHRDPPAPRPAALLSAAAGLLLIWSLLLFLDEIGGDDQRIAGFLVSLLFQAIGVGLLLLSRDQRSANAGVALFGGAYLAGAGWRDRSGDRRQATVGFAVAIPILTVAVLFLTQPLEVEGAAAVGIGLGAVGLWLGARTGRRFTSWYGTLAIVVGVLTLVTDALEDSQRAMDLVLLALGVALAAAAAYFGDGPTPLRPPDSRSEPPGPDNAWAPSPGYPPPGGPGQPQPGQPGQWAQPGPPGYGGPPAPPYPTGDPSAGERPPGRRAADGLLAPSSRQ